MAPTPDGGGYWVLGANGTVYTFGDAPQVGVSSVSPPLSSMRSPMTGLIPDFSGRGFDAVNGSGQAFAFGDAPYFGDVTTAVQRLFRPRRGHRRHSRLTRATVDRRGNRRSRPRGPSRPASTPWSAALSSRRSPRLLP